MRFRRSDYDRLAPWPLAMAAALAWSSAVALLSSVTARDSAGEALLVIGSVLVGAWIALLARAGYNGLERRDEDSDEDASDRRDTPGDDSD